MQDAETEGATSICRQKGTPQVIVSGAYLPVDVREKVDIHIEGDRIVAIIPHEGATSQRNDDAATIDAQGRVAFPGFIDSHVHAEGALFDPEVQRALLRQGITSVVLGQDGVSFAPSPAGAEFDAAAWAGNYFAAINGAAPQGFSGGSVRDFLDVYDRTTPVNVGYVIPHGTVRYAVKGGGPGDATDAEIAEMVALVEEGLLDGACGLSTGLEYTPAKFSSTRELEAILGVVARSGLPHVSHMRGYESAAVTALDELRALAEATGVHTHVSHLHGPFDEISVALDAFTRAGLGLSFDTYPYLRGCTILSMLALPSWLPVADVDATLDALADPSIRQRLHDEHLSSLEDLWPRVTLAAVPGVYSWAEGVQLVDVAERMGVSAAHCLVELLIASRLKASAVFAQPPTNSPESVESFAHDDRHVAGSDSIYQGGHPHPRGWGTFANYVKTYVAERKSWSYADAVEHLAARSARMFGFSDVGEVAVGRIADIALVDIAAVEDRATYESPRVDAVGVDDVIVRGRVVLRDGELTGELAGRPLIPTR